VSALLAGASAAAQPKPNILFILVDNLGYGELGEYGGGATRGAPTPRIDTLAREGLRLTNMNAEAQCTPSRSSIMTGRYAIRSDGIPRTTDEALWPSSAGYSPTIMPPEHVMRRERREEPRRQGLRRRAAAADRRGDHATFDRIHGAPDPSEEAPG
jgi:arylsulfatase A-like enzyme